MNPHAERALLAWQPPPPFEIAAPDVTLLLAGWSCDRAIRDKAHWLSEGSNPLHRFASAGMLSRLWVSASAEDARADAARILVDEPTPSRRARRWAASLPAETLVQLDHCACLESENLEDTLFAVTPGAHAVAWLEAREVLRCAVDLLCHLRAAKLSAPDHSRLDHLGKAATNLGINEDDSDLLAAVAWQYPECWWGRP